MKILIDQNISFRLLPRIASVFPNALHIKSLNLTDANDYVIFMYARQETFDVIFTQDEDFYHLLLEHSTPPKVVWLRIGNCSVAFLADVIIRNTTLIESFLLNDIQDCLEIYG